jgi:hypothetical protein
MLIERTSMLTGITRSIELPITGEQWAAYEAGALVQDAFPHLSPDEREFIITGITEEEWDDIFRDEE